MTCNFDGNKQENNSQIAYGSYSKKLRKLVHRKYYNRRYRFNKRPK